MIYAVIAILVSTGIVITFKLFNRFQINNLQAITINYLVASFFGFLIYTGEVQLTEIPDQGWFKFAVFIGFLFIAVFFVFALSAQEAGIAITAVSSKMSVVIPVIVGVVFYSDESMSAIKSFGVIFTLLAFYFIFKTGKKEKIKRLFILLPVLLFFGNGSNDTLLNYCQKTYLGNTNSLILFLNVIFTTSLVLGILLLAYQVIRKKTIIKGKNLLAGSILGLLNFSSTYYVLKSLTLMQGSVFFPIFNVCMVGLSAIIGYFAFKENLRPLNWLGIVLAAIAICLVAIS